MTPSELTIARFSDGYKSARKVTQAGRLVSTVAILLGVPFFFFGLTEARDGQMGQVLFLWVLGAVFALIGYALGKLLQARGCILAATIDQTVSACPLLTEAERFEVISLEVNESRGPLGIQSLGGLSQPTPKSPGRNAEEGPFHSPIENLFANYPSTAPVYLAPMVRHERRLARPARRLR